MSVCDWIGYILLSHTHTNNILWCMPCCRVLFKLSMSGAMAKWLISFSLATLRFPFIMVPGCLLEGKCHIFAYFNFNVKHLYHSWPMNLRL